MKKIRILSLLLIAALVLAGCGKKQNKWDKETQYGDVVVVEEPSQEQLSQKPVETSSSEVSSVQHGTESSSEVTESNITESETAIQDENIYMVERKIGCIGENVYYYEDVVNAFTQDGEKEKIADAMGKLSEYIKEINPEVQIIAYNFSFYEETTFIDGYQYCNGIIDEDVKVAFSIAGDNIEMIDGSVIDFVDSATIGNSELLNVEELYDTAISMFAKHKKDIVGDDEEKEMPVTVSLSADKNGYYYKFETLNGSFIQFDAILGNLLEESYSTGGM